MLEWSMLEAEEGWRGGVAVGDLEPYCPSPDCGSAGAEVAVLKACRCPTPGGTHSGRRSVKKL